jgi:hypothetical protein
VIILVLLSVGLLSCLLMMFLWNHTSIVAGRERSLSFLALIFVIGAVDCTSSVVYWSFISNYKHYCTIALTIGEGLTSIIAALVGLLMGPGENPLFSFPILCVLLFAILTASAIGFCLLRFLPRCKKQMITNATTVTEQQFLLKNSNEPAHGIASNDSITIEDANGHESEDIMTETDIGFQDKILVSVRLTLIQMCLSFAQNGILVSIAPYVFDGYPKSIELLRYSILISFIVDPIFCFLAYASARFYHWTVALLAHSCWVILFVYLFYAALVNSRSSHRGSLTIGIILLIITTITRMLMAFCKTSEWLLAHKKIEKWNTAQNSIETSINKCNFIKRMELSPFRLGGLGIQVGSLLGAITIMLLTKNKIFH